MKWLVLAIALSACGGGDKAEKPEGADPKKAACDSAIERGVTMTLERRMAMGGGQGSPNLKKLVEELKPKLTATLGDLCIKDQWDDAVVSCFQTAPDIAKCKTRLSPEQRSKYTQAMMQVMMSQGGMGGAAGHGSGLPSTMKPPAGSGSN